MEQEIDYYQNLLQELQKKITVVIEDEKRREQKETQLNFYKLQITPEDIEDIKELKLIEKRLSKKEVLNKLIYKVYFEKPYTDLVGRVLGERAENGNL